MQFAAMVGCCGCIRALASHSGNVNSPNDAGLRPIHRAAMNGKVDAIDTLARHGADINVVDASGRTALFYAALQGHAATVLYLAFNMGADLSIAAHGGESPLDAATRQGNADCISALQMGGTGYRAIYGPDAEAQVVARIRSSAA